MQQNKLLSIDIDKSLQREPNFSECFQAAHPCFLRGLPKGVTPAHFITLVKKLFDKNNPRQRLSKIKPQQPRIPRIIHRIWFGDTMPNIYTEWHKALKALHPGWTFICWDEKEIKKVFPRGLHNQKMFDQARKTRSFAKMSDIARYEILNKYGGLYLDYDVECFQSFDFLHNAFDFYAGMEDFWSSCYCCNAVIGANREHPVIQTCIKTINSYENKTPDLEDWPYRNRAEKEKYITLITTGPKMFTHSIWYAANRTNNIDIIFPPEVFYSQQPTPFSLCRHNFHSLWHGNLFEQ